MLRMPPEPHLPASSRAWRCGRPRAGKKTLMLCRVSARGGSTSTSSGGRGDNEAAASTRHRQRRRTGSRRGGEASGKTPARQRQRRSKSQISGPPTGTVTGGEAVTASPRPRAETERPRPSATAWQRAASSESLFASALPRHRWHLRVSRALVHFRRGVSSLPHAPRHRGRRLRRRK